MRNLIGSIFAAVYLAFFSFCGPVCAQGGYVDVHVHFDPMGMKQKGFSGAGPRGQKQQRGNAESNYKNIAGSIVSFMNEMNVEKAILMPPPQIPSQGNKSTYTQYFSAVKNYPQRLYLGGGGGILNPLIYKYGQDEVTQEVRTEFRRKAEQLIKAGIVVFGEMAALHLSMQEHHIFSQVIPDHPLFLLLADIAAENNIPIDLHMEAVPYDMPTPSSLLKASSNNPDTLKANIQGFERLLAHNRRAKIVWQHIGWDNIGYMTIELLTDLLNRHSNLYIALRAECRQMKMDKSGPMPNRIIDSDWNVRPEWKKFITDFASRIVIGSDDFMGTVRQSSRPKNSFEETWGMLEQFPEETAHKIGRDNAVWIYNLN